MVQHDDGSIEIGQEEYCNQLKPCEITRERRRQRDQRLTEKEVSQLRAITGAINWAVTSSRPDLAAANAVLQQRVSKATVADLIEANKLIAEARDHAKMTVKIQPMEWSRFAIVAPSDSSWGSEQDLSSQGAYMICATERDIETGQPTKVSPLKWKSYKQERQVNSTLAAETIAVSRGMSEAGWVRQFFLEMTQPSYTLETAEQCQQQIPIYIVTDNKPLFDFCHNDVTVAQDKRLMIELLLIRRDLARNNVCLRRVETNQMLVDCLTKTKVKPHLLRYVLATGLYAIMKEENMLEAKKNGRLLKQQQSKDSTSNHG